MIHVFFAVFDLPEHSQNNGAYNVPRVEQTSFAWVFLAQLSGGGPQAFGIPATLANSPLGNGTQGECIRGISPADSPILRALLQRALGFPRVQNASTVLPAYDLLSKLATSLPRLWPSVTRRKIHSSAKRRTRLLPLSRMNFSFSRHSFVSLRGWRRRHSRRRE